MTRSWRAKKRRGTHYAGLSVRYQPDLNRDTEVLINVTGTQTRQESFFSPSTIFRNLFTGRSDM